MKTKVYDNKEHLEGYVGAGEQKEKDKSPVQKKYEKGNDTQEVMSYGNETSTKPHVANYDARDGYDNTGTQGKDSLSDDTYHTDDIKPCVIPEKHDLGNSSKEL